MKKLTLPLLLSLVCTPLQAEEVLNLELLCTGEFQPLFSNIEDEKTFNGFQLLPLTAKDLSFEERFSIVDNRLEEIIDLIVEDNWIRVSSEGSKIVEEKGFKITGSIDRLTGRISAKVLIDENNANLLAEAGEVVKGMNGVRVNGACEKLDPEKKVF